LNQIGGRLDHPATEPSAAAGSAIWQRISGPVLIAAGALMLCWPAFYNGYPLLWFDSCGYLMAGWRLFIPEMGSPFYGLALVPLLALKSEWPIVLAQAATATALIFLVLRTVLGQVRPWHYLLLLGTLALLTDLSWHSSLIMANVFTAFLPLGVFLLVFARERLAWWEAVFVFGVTCVASLVHYSHLPLMAALGLAASAILLLERRNWRDVLAGAGCCLAIVAITIAGHMAMQERLHHRLAITPARSLFLLARFVEDGPAKDYLSAHCPQAHFALCAYLDRMPMDSSAFLWDADGPVRILGGPDAIGEESDVIVAGILREQPLRVAWQALTNTLEQLVKLHMGRSLRQFDSANHEWQKCEALMEVRTPVEYMEYVTARQSIGRLDADFVFSLQPPAAGLSVLLLFLTLSTGVVLRFDRRIWELTWLVLAALLANALICGAVSGPEGRYQSRMMWLVLLLLFLTAPAALKSWRERRRPAPVV
jgi:hypothetical protein